MVSRPIHRFVAVLLLGICWLAGFTQKSLADSPVEAKYDNFAALRLRMERIAQSNLAELSSLGESKKGREVLMLTLGKEDATAKPAWLILGSVQGTDLAAGELTLQAVELLLSQASGEPRDAKAKAEKLLQRVTLYVIPRPSPDASERYFAKLQYESSLNARPRDDDRDGETNEDPADDLDGNGIITMMRVESPVGDWITHPEDDRVLIKADPKKNELGKYLLYSEGVDNDGDGKWNEDGLGGVDFNLNYTFKYPFFEAGAGANQVSEPETRAVADFAFNHPNIAAVISFSPQDNIHHPWKPNSSAENSKYKSTLLSADAPYQEKLVSLFQKAIKLQDAPSAAKEDGAFAPWAYFHFGRWSLSTRPWWVPKVSPERLAEVRAERAGKKEESPSEEKSGEKEGRGADDLNALRWLEVEQIDGFINWKAVDHPDFPGQKVEVGGFKPYVLTNPPVRLLKGLADQHVQAWTEAAGLLPKLSLPEVKCKPVGAGLYRLTLVVRNDGFLPTMPAHGKASKLLHDLQYELKLPEGVNIYEGHPRGKLPVLSGQGGHAERTWLLLGGDKARGALQITVSSPSVGTVSKQIDFPPSTKPAK